ncbi:DNA-directed RNA polymerase I subunit 1 [Dictyocoela muelleri]|nr:DNA-directed RNA polymerase I subunit 1 [Dictyocoela muelleri]
MIFNPEKIKFEFYNHTDLSKITEIPINNVTTFDTFGHPLPGGIHDPLLGPLPGDSHCKKCNLSFIDCPGHFGRIELEEIVVNPLCVQHVLRIINGVCLNCGQFLSIKDSSIFINNYKSINDSIDKNKYDDINNNNSINNNCINNNSINSININNNSININNNDCIDINNDCMNYDDYLTTLKNKNKLMQVLKEGHSILKCKKCFKQSPKFIKGKNMRILQKQLGTFKYQSSSEIKKIINFIYNNNHHIRNLFFKNKNPDIYFIKIVPVLPNKFRPLNVHENAFFEDQQNQHLTDILKINNLIRSIKYKKAESVKTEGDDEKNNERDNSENDINENTFTSDDNSNKNNFNNDSHKEKKKRANDRAGLKTDLIELDDAIDCLQTAVLHYYDSDTNKTKRSSIGLKQMLEKKEGLFRKHVMGKRVNYAARSVISPDPHLSTREIGIPLVFAEKLTFPERVNDLNHDRLKKAVLNGTKYPGALFVEENKILKNIKFLTDHHKRQIANQLRLGEKIVHRHLMNGDIVLLNRQPTLHKPSIMSHIVKILPNEKTIRMHYSNCNSYNADFDGDEMNIHFMQDHLSRSEGYSLCITDRNYLVATNGTPIRGLVQDHVVIAARLTMKDTFLNEDEYKSYLLPAIDNNDYEGYKFNYQSLDEDQNNKIFNHHSDNSVNNKNKKIILLKPAISRPKRIFTGKQLISTILQNLNLKISFMQKNRIPENILGSHKENIVIFKNGIHMTGILDKSIVGPSPHNLIHACGEIFGYNICNDLLTSLSRVFNRILVNEGFTLGLDDLYLDEESERIRKFIQDEGKRKGREVVDKIYRNEYQSLKSKNYDDKNVTSNTSSLLFSKKINKSMIKQTVKKLFSKTDQVDLKVKSEMNSITTENHKTLLTGQQKKFPYNNMSLIILSGAKGSMVNFGQISTLLGQQELEGKRVPIMISGRSLPCYDPFNSDVNAGGYIFSRFLTGITQTDFYFHCMAGREGLIDTAVKTSLSGYLQRCLIKHLEGVKVEYDQTVRNSNKAIIQFQYGEDNKDTTKCSFDNVNGFFENNWNFYKKRNIIFSNTIFSNKNKFTGDKDNFKEILKMKKFIEPGEPVGIIAAQAIGEPSTQMTLNTFHLAGVGSKNVTLGMPRLRELLMVASKNPQTPLIIVPINRFKNKDENNDKNSNDKNINNDNAIINKLIKTIITDFNSSKFSDLINSYQIYETFNSSAQKKIITIKFHFIKNNMDYSKYLKKIKRKLLLEISKIHQEIFKEVGLTKKESKIKNVLKNDLEGELESNNEFNDTLKQELFDDYKEDDLDDDINENKNIDENNDDQEDDNEKNDDQENDYQENDDQENDNLEYGDNSLDDLLDNPLDNDFNIKNESSIDKIELSINPDISIDVPLVLNNIIDNISTDCFEGIKRIVQENKNLIISCDSYYSLFSGIKIKNLNKDSKNSISYENKNYYKNEEHPNCENHKYKDDEIKNDNYISINDLVDFYHSYSNNVYDCSISLGIEAARTTIIREIKSVFDVYGISIDIRHLMLIADYMCMNGVYSPFSRIGLSNMVSEPFHKMSFESSYSKIRDCVIMEEIDQLMSPSSRLTLGIPIDVGTGCFRVLYDYENTE